MGKGGVDAGKALKNGSEVREKGNLYQKKYV